MSCGLLIVAGRQPTLANFIHDLLSEYIYKVADLETNKGGVNWAVNTGRRSLNPISPPPPPPPPGTATIANTSQPHKISLCVLWQFCGLRNVCVYVCVSVCMYVCVCVCLFGSFAD